MTNRPPITRNDSLAEGDRKKEPYIFSRFSQRLQEKFGQFMKDRMANRSPAADQHSRHSTEDGTDAVAKALVAAASKIPFYMIRSAPGAPHPRHRKDHGQIPILFSLLTAKVATATNSNKNDDDDSDDNNNRDGDDPHRQDDEDDYLSIDLAYGRALRWRIKRRVKDIIKLHYLLQWRHVKGLIPALPKLPSIRTLKQPAALDNYFAELFKVLQGDFGCVDVCEFLEISTASISQPDRAAPGQKPLEGYLKCAIKYKTQQVSGPKHLIANLTPQRIQYKNYWLMLRSSCIVVAEGPHDDRFLDVIMVDAHFKIGVENEFAQRHSISRHLHPFAIHIHHGQDRRLKIRPSGRAQVEDWLERLRELAARSEWRQSHRYSAPAPIRPLPQIDWLVDARQYFARLVQDIETATRCIYIQGWWVSPELQLIRPAANYPDYRLDRLLRRKAEEGVQVNIIVFKEITMSLAINSLHTKQTLQRMHPNIHVLRHPDHYAAGQLYWAHHEKMVVIDHRIVFVGGLDLCYGRFDSPDHQLADQGKGYWHGLEYANPTIKQYTTVTNPDEEILDSRVIPRMPWHDVQMRAAGPVAGDFSRHFITRWNFVKVDKALESVPFLIPQHETVRYSEEYDDKGAAVVDDDGAASQVQLVRSSTKWSLGLPLNTSLYDAHLSIIANAQRYIFLENQYLVSVENKIKDALAERIISAHRAKEAFRVIIVVPLIPAFEAPLDRPESTTCRIVMQAQYNTLSRGDASLLGLLRAAGIEDHEDYVAVVSLRKHGRLESCLVTEQIYVHSKVLIADDRVALVSSANINDRSLLGSRDSEIGCVVEGRDCVSELRRRLLAEHLGMEVGDKELDLDIWSDRFYRDILLVTAKTNTDAYRELFFCLPDDKVRTWEQYKEAKEKSAASPLDSLTPDQYKVLHQIHGHVVMFPMDFLCEEDLSASIFSREYLLPIEVYI